MSRGAGRVTIVSLILKNETFIKKFSVLLWIEKKTRSVSVPQISAHVLIFEIHVTKNLEKIFIYFWFSHSILKWIFSGFECDFSQPLGLQLLLSQKNLSVWDTSVERNALIIQMNKSYQEHIGKHTIIYSLSRKFLRKRKIIFLKKITLHFYCYCQCFTINGKFSFKILGSPSVSCYVCMRWPFTLYVRFVWAAIGPSLETQIEIFQHLLQGFTRCHSKHGILKNN